MNKILASLKLWEGEARKKRIAKWIQPEEQLNSTIHQIKSSTIRVIQSMKPRKAVCPRSRHSSGDLGQTTKATGLKVEEGSSGMQAKEEGSFQIKHPLPPHLMHYTNLVYCINGKITLEQCLYSLQPTLPLPAK